MICRNKPILVLQERKTRYLLGVKLEGRKADEVVNAIIEAFQGFDNNLLKTITFDNDMGFAQHRILQEKLDISTWFCDAYASWQKGGVENANGWLRRELPRKIDLDKLTHQDLNDTIQAYNLTPRKCLNFKTPLQAMLQEKNIHVNISSLNNVHFRFEPTRSVKREVSQET